jgi:hypothetical protein
VLHVLLFPCNACLLQHPNPAHTVHLGGFLQVHVKLHLVTQATYHTPGAAVASRLLVRVLQELLLPDTYHASLAGSSFHLQTEQTGLQLSLVGFTEVVPELLRRVLSAMTGAGCSPGLLALHGCQDSSVCVVSTHQQITTTLALSP